MKKSKTRFFAAVLASMIAGTVALTACSNPLAGGTQSSASSSSQSSESSSKADTKESSGSTGDFEFTNGYDNTVAIGTPSKKVDASSAYKTITYTPEMFTNRYSVLGSEDSVKTKVTETGYYKYNEQASSGGGVERQITNLPFDIEGMSYTYKDSKNGDSILYVMKARFYDEKGNTQYKYFKYSVEGRKLNMTEIKDIKYDDDYTAVTSYETAQLELSYDFTFKGIELKLERANHSIKMSCDYIDSKKDEAPYISVHGFLAKGSPVIDHIAGFSMSRGSEGTYSSIYITFINDKNEDETSSYCHGILKEDGTFTFSIPYATETKTYQYVYFLVEKGIILSDGIVNYKYTEKEDEFKKYKLSAVIGDEDADSISADKQKKLTIVQNSILTDLEKAFADKDIKADIDKATGRVSLDSNILFASDSSDLSSDGKDSLDDFLDVYTSVVLNDSNKDLVANIVVEGHTDTNGDHEYNQKLSEKRAETVADYCTEKVPSLKSIIKSKGYSFDDPVYNDDGTINMEASRRVVFKFVLDTK
ncbi:OmpA family protein [Ruminococcus sp.]|uniref:OmpA family protein n=1 Tax=Ruminococcus sp. TaxID=41978 RepID=UPI002E7773D7|nr:OmpA family protein [Ruminococcus sp.]MEE1262481.1 OmpA family protein [Ruminococcus sp.]